MPSIGAAGEGGKEAATRVISAATSISGAAASSSWTARRLRGGDAPGLAGAFLVENGVACHRLGEAEHLAGIVQQRQHLRLFEFRHADGDGVAEIGLKLRTGPVLAAEFDRPLPHALRLRHGEHGAQLARVDGDTLPAGGNGRLIYLARRAVFQAAALPARLVQREGNCRSAPATRRSCRRTVRWAGRPSRSSCWFGRRRPNRGAIGSSCIRGL